MELGYNITLPALKNAGISNARIYVNATNIFTIDKLKVADPEADSKDITSYPQRRVWHELWCFINILIV